MGFGRTNYNNSNETNSGGSSQAGTADLPTHLESLEIVGGNQCATLTLAYSNTDFVTGVRVCYKTGSYPTNPEDGSYIDTNEAATSIKITGLTNAITYYFRIFLYHIVDNTTYFQTDIVNAEIATIPNAVYVEGITPKEVGENYILLTESGTFTLCAPATVYIYLVGGGCSGNSYGTADYSTPGGSVYIKMGGQGGGGGYVYKFNKELNNEKENCTITIGDVGRNDTIIQIEDTIYKSSSGTVKNGGNGQSYGYNPSGGVNNYAKNGENGISSPIGYVGSSGGGGAATHSYGKGGIGAGDGGCGNRSATSATSYGCGGGGAKWDDSIKGSGMQGCVIIAWDN